MLRYTNYYSKPLPQCDSITYFYACVHAYLQVASAWDHLQRHAAVQALDHALSVTVLSSAFRRGIYLRHPSEVSRRETYKVNIKPLFPEHVSLDTQLNFEWKLQLSSSARWVVCPEYVILAQSGKTFSVEVDPCGLSEGMHTTTVRGVLLENPNAGFVFELPVTVLKPQVVTGFDVNYNNNLSKNKQPIDDMDTNAPSLQDIGNANINTASSIDNGKDARDADNTLSLGTLSLEQGERYRKFLVPPLGCTYMDVVICDARHYPCETGDDTEETVPGETEGGSGDNASARMLVLHIVQLMKGSPYCKHEKQVGGAGIMLILPYYNSLFFSFSSFSLFDAKINNMLSQGVHQSSSRVSARRLVACSGRVSDGNRHRTKLEQCGRDEWWVRDGGTAEYNEIRRSYINIPVKLLNINPMLYCDVCFVELQLPVMRLFTSAARCQNLSR